MLEAGIHDGHARHLWPYVGKRACKLTLNQARRRFEKGGKFVTNNDEIVTPGDLPRGCRVIIHAQRARLALTIN